MFRNLLTLICTGILFLGANLQANEAGYDPVSMDPPQLDMAYPPDFAELLIPSHDVMLTGFMLVANGKGPHPSVLLLHGFPGNEKNLDLAQSLRRAGYNVLFFHYRGAWGSQGDYTIAGQADDVAAVLDYVRKEAQALRVDTGRISLIGHSMGGFTALRAAAAHKEIKCTVGLAAANFDEETGLGGEQAKQELAAYTEQLFMLANYNGAKVLAEIQANAAAFDVRNQAGSFAGRSVLLITGNEDTEVPPAVQSLIAAAFEKVPGINLTSEFIPGDHAFSVSRIRLQRTVIEWMERNCR
ncbi:MAG TPA: alpha/beta fold hydrolase [Xanthomonadales bacterium]